MKEGIGLFQVEVCNPLSLYYVNFNQVSFKKRAI